MKLHFFILFILVSTFRAHADYRTGQHADVLIGRPAKTHFSPQSVGVDPVSQKVFVLDSSHGRVLRYSSVAALQEDAEPEAIIGQPDAYTFTGGTAANRLDGPKGLSLDAAGRLWVADSGNHRVLRFDNAASLPTGAAASGVIGQTDFTSATAGTAENRLKGPVGVTMDAGGRLWVLDAGNHRVLRWDSSVALVPAAFASGVLGQTNFSTGASGTSATALKSPEAIALEYSGSALTRLWVADTQNHRVLAWNSPASRANGAAADKVLGGSTFGTITLSVPPTRSSLNRPGGLALDGADLWIADSSNNRLLLFSAAGSKSNGADADSVLGQFNYSEEISGTGLTNFNNPGALCFAGSRLWIADAQNQRLVRHDSTAGKFGLVAADGVLGVKATPGDSYSSAEGVAVDPVTGKLFVADTRNSRVLRYADARAMATGAQPEAVLGQPDFVSTGIGLSAARMHYPSGLTVDVLGNLWVADAWNSRVLRFANASSLTSGAAAVQVLGQTSFTGGQRGGTASRMDTPSGVVTEWALTPSFNQVIVRLWVADELNHRVLRFDNPIALGNGGAATVVLGQPGFTSNQSDLSATRMFSPSGLAVEQSGRLWVSDTGNQRVLRFDNAAAKASGAAADGVLLQSGFNSSAGTMHPGKPAVTAQGRLFVPLTGQQRVVWFNNAATKAPGAAPDGVLGQPDTTSTATGSGFSGMYSPAGVALDLSGRLWVVNSLMVQRYSPQLESTITGFGFNAQNRFFLNILGAGGETFTIRSSTDLQNWSTIERTETVSGIGTKAITWTAPSAPTGPRKFYRLQGQ